MKLSRSLRRLRLEVDQALRTRSFFSRAVRGLLRPEESLDLIAQLAFLLYQVGGEQSATLMELAGRDAISLGPATSAPPPPPPCTAVLLMGELMQSGRVPSKPAFEVLLALVGTSWVSSAAGATPDGQFLAELERASSRCLLNLDRHATPPDEVRELISFAELGRGAVFGLSSYLEHTWPAPIHVERLRQSPLHHTN